VLEELRRGRLEAAMISLPVADDTMLVRPVAREELVYVSRDPERLSSPGDGQGARGGRAGAARRRPGARRTPRGCCSTASPRRPGSRCRRGWSARTWRPRSSWCSAGWPTRSCQRAVLDELGPRLAPDVGWVSLRPASTTRSRSCTARTRACLPGRGWCIDLAVARIQAGHGAGEVPATG
jgi:hypothetical protein